jgi:hypothetical protein
MTQPTNTGDFVSERFVEQSLSVINPNAVLDAEWANLRNNIGDHDTIWVMSKSPEYSTVSEARSYYNTNIRDL